MGFTRSVRLPAKHGDVSAADEVDVVIDEIEEFLTGTRSSAEPDRVLATVLIIFTTVINALGVKLMARINSAGVFIELIAACERYHVPLLRTPIGTPIAIQEKNVTSVPMRPWKLGKMRGAAGSESRSLPNVMQSRMSQPVRDRIRRSPASEEIQ